MSGNSAAVDAALQRLTALFPREIDLSLDRVRHLLSRLGDPHLAVPPVIHVAGTNGKGSTVAMMRACCEAAGMRVHAYTSPHLVRFNERIRIAGSLIGDGDLLGLLDEIERRNDGTPITFFEITTVAAFLAFAREPADILLLETGLGGRLDASNVVERPLASVITPIGMDHMRWLGETLGAIATEKAGIVKPGTPVVCVPQQPEALAPIERAARAAGSPLLLGGRDWRGIAEENGGWRYEGARWRFDLPAPSLLGRHQIDNAAGAVAALEVALPERFDAATLARGLRSAEWPARMQRLTRGPLAALLPPPHELWLDGAHNAHAAGMLDQVTAGWAGRPLHVIVGALSNRAVGDLLGPWAHRIATLHGVAIPGVEASHPAEDVARIAAGMGVAAEPAPSVEAAIRCIAAGASGPVRVLICGSLYLAGTILTENG